MKLYRVSGHITVSERRRGIQGTTMKVIYTFEKYFMGREGLKSAHINFDIQMKQVEFQSKHLMKHQSLEVARLEIGEPDVDSHGNVLPFNQKVVRNYEYDSNHV